MPSILNLPPLAIASICLISAHSNAPRSENDQMPGVQKGTPLHAVSNLQHLAVTAGRAKLLQDVIGKVAPQIDAHGSPGSSGASLLLLGPPGVGKSLS